MACLFVRKYSNLLLIPILLTIFTEEEDRKRGCLRFSAALVITLLASYALAFGWHRRPVASSTGTPDDPDRVQISHLAQRPDGVCVCAVRGVGARARGRARWVCALLAVLAVVNVMLMVKGRTGYVVLAGLVLLWIASNLRWKGLAAADRAGGGGFHR